MLIAIRAILAVAIVAVAGPVHAGTSEDRIAKAVEKRLSVPAGPVTKTKFSGLYEVDTPRGLVYTDKDASFILVNGIVVDTATGRNLTEQRLNELGAFKFSDLPFHDAIKTVYGDGRRVLFTIEDPNCGYCKRLAADLAKLKNVTVYTLLVPILGEDSHKKSQAVLCAADRSKAWNDYMISAKPLPTKTDCETPIERSIAVARRLRVTGTPLIFFPSGERVPGAIPVDQIELKLAGK